MNSSARLLALSVRRRKIGYAVLERPSRLVDWGVSRRRGTGRIEILAKRKLTHLLRLYAPSVVVVSEMIRGQAHDGVVRGVLLAIQEACERSSIRFISFHQTAIKTHFVDYGCKTKHAIANLIAGAFPELASFLPQPRKPWENEGHNLPLFEAAAVGIAFLNEQAAIDEGLE